MKSMARLMPTHKYDDIIDRKPPDSGRHVRMSLVDRGAQFAPFAALTGYDAVIAETARLTDQDTDLTEGSIAALDEKLRQIESRIRQTPAVALVCFRPDVRKDGGSYVRITGRVKKLDPYAQCLILTDQREIPFSTLKSIEILE